MAKKKKYDFEDFHFREVSKMFMALKCESDRAVALILTAWLDDALAEMIKRRLVQDKKVIEDIFQYYAALGTFSSRIKLGYLIGRISETAYKNLEIIRDLRNDFAHSRDDLHFTNESISARCSNLYLKEFKDQEMGSRADEKFNPRNAFIATGIGMLGFFTEFISSATISADGKDCFPEFMKHMEETTMPIIAKFMKCDSND